MRKTAIVTGGAKGIGKAIVEMLAKQNYQVILNYKTSEIEAKQIQKQLTEEGFFVEIYQADVSQKEEAQNLVKQVLEKYKNIEVLVNNAGISQTKLFTDITEEDWTNMIQNNLTSAFYMTQSVILDMIHQKQGCIINISSVWGIVGASCEVHYSVAKAGLDAMTKSLAKELGPSGIRVNSIAPGIIETQMNHNLAEEEKKAIKDEIPLQQIGKPEDIAKCIKWMIEDNYTTGQIISINGGWFI